MDVQQGIVERFDPPAGALLDAVRRAVDAARQAGIPVVYVRIAFRPGAPEINRRNASFAAVAASGFSDQDEATQIHADVAPQPGDIVVLKKRVSAFARSDLEIVLRSLQVESLALTGIATSGVVLSTVRWAFDMDYSMVVVADACADRDAEVHRVLTQKVLLAQATVVSTAEALQALGSAK